LVRFSGGRIRRDGGYREECWRYGGSILGGNGREIMMEMNIGRGIDRGTEWRGI
jgi:hypothetical protein